MGAVWIFCCFLLVLGTATVGSSDKSLNEVEHEKKESVLRNVVAMLLALLDVDVDVNLNVDANVLANEASNDKEVALESNAVEAVPPDHVLSNDTAGGAQNQTSPVTQNDYDRNVTLNDASNATLNDSTEPSGNHTSSEKGSRRRRHAMPFKRILR